MSQWPVMKVKGRFCV